MNLVSGTQHNCNINSRIKKFVINPYKLIFFNELKRELTKDSEFHSEENFRKIDELIELLNTEINRYTEGAI